MNTAAEKPGKNGNSPSPGPGADGDPELHELLKRCSPATYEAARRFRHTGDPVCLPAIIAGIIEHHMEPDLRAKLREPDDNLRLIEDLGLDSLTLIEVAMLAEDVLRISIPNEELAGLRSLGDVKQLVLCRLCNLPAAVPAAPEPGPWLVADKAPRAT
ncbi:MAG TPA: acyl carrier protein [Opitutaceae bacterium]|nr:acyl carrier protein [Opitutaceae bacterium]